MTARVTLGLQREGRVVIIADYSSITSSAARGGGILIRKAFLPHASILTHSSRAVY